MRTSTLLHTLMAIGFALSASMVHAGGARHAKPQYEHAILKPDADFGVSRAKCIRPSHLKTICHAETKAGDRRARSLAKSRRARPVSV